MYVCVCVRVSLLGLSLGGVRVCVGGVRCVSVYVFRV